MRFKNKFDGTGFNFFIFDDYETFSKLLNIWGINTGATLSSSESGSVVASTVYLGLNDRYGDEIMVGEWLGFTDDLKKYDILPTIGMIEKYYELDCGYRYPDEFINRVGHLLTTRKKAAANT